MKIKRCWLALPVAAMALSGCVVPAGILVGASAVAVHTAAQERTPRTTFADADIQLTLNTRYLEQSAALFSDVATSVTEGRVVLTGSVGDRSDKVTATEIAWSVPGVTAVTDELTVNGGQGAVAYAEDALISNRLRLALLADTGINSFTYTVETVDKTVHITGLAHTKTELANVIDHAARIPGVVRVVSHVLTVDDPRRHAATLQQSQGTG